MSRLHPANGRYLEQHIPVRGGTTGKTNTTPGLVRLGGIVRELCADIGESLVDIRGDGRHTDRGCERDQRHDQSILNQILSVLVKQNLNLGLQSQQGIPHVVCPLCLKFFPPHRGMKSRWQFETHSSIRCYLLPYQGLIESNHFGWS